MNTNTVKKLKNEIYFGDINTPTVFYSSSTLAVGISIEAADDRDFLQRTDTEPRQRESWYEYANIAGILSEYFGNVYSIKGIYILDNQNATQVWIVISEDTEKIRDLIYDAEYEILRNYKFLNFDFHINVLEEGFSENTVPSSSKQVIIKN